MKIEIMAQKGMYLSELMYYSGHQGEKLSGGIFSYRKTNKQ